MIQRSNIKFRDFRPTTGYHKATEEIKRFYDGFQIYNFSDPFNPQRAIDDINDDSVTLQQLLSINYHYAPNFFSTMKNQKLDNLRRRGWEEEVQMHETAIQKEKIMELYLILPEN
eukprot:326607-Amphidinium_carterae.2